MVKKWSLKIFHILEHWLNTSNHDFKPEMAEELEYELKRIDYTPTTPHSLYRGIKTPEEDAYYLWGTGMLQQPSLTSWSTDINIAREFAAESTITLNPVSSSWGQSIIASNYNYDYNPNVILNMQDLHDDDFFEYSWKMMGVDSFPNIGYYIFDENNKEKEVVCKTPLISYEQIEILGYNPGRGYPVSYTPDAKWINKSEFGNYSPYYDWQWRSKLF